VLIPDDASRRTYTGLSDGAYVFLVQSVTLTAILGPATETDFAIDTTGPVLTNVSVTVGCEVTPLPSPCLLHVCSWRMGSRLPIPRPTEGTNSADHQCSVIASHTRAACERIRRSKTSRLAQLHLVEQS